MAKQNIDATSASELQTLAVPSEQEWHDQAEVALAKYRAHYHVIAGLLVGPPNWPAEFANAIRTEAPRRAKWEMRHRQLSAELLGALADHELRAPVIKSPTFAYDLYDEPAHRIRVDSDLWVSKADLGFY